MRRPGGRSLKDQSGPLREIGAVPIPPCGAKLEVVNRNSAMSWTTIESDPGVFSELISQFGAKNIKVQEVWDLSYESLRRLGRVHGLIFLFKFESGTESAREHLCYVEDDPTVFFATQVCMFYFV